MRKNKGFSLIELLIVVAIILIIAAIAIPNLLRARIAANEASAASTVRTINTAQIEYLTAYPTVGYAASLAALGDIGVCPASPSSASACLIDNALSTGTKSGYTFAISNTVGSPVNQYQVKGNPVTPNQSGNRGFCSFEDAVVRYSTGTIAGACTGAISPLQ